MNSQIQSSTKLGFEIKLQSTDDMEQKMNFLQAAKAQRQINALQNDGSVSQRSRRSAKSKRSKRSRVSARRQNQISDSELTFVESNEQASENDQPDFYHRKHTGTDSSNSRQRTLKFDIDDDVDGAAVQTPFYLISQTSFFRLFWNLIVAIVFIYIALVVPFRLSFLTYGAEPLWMLWLDVFIDSILILDIFINFLKVVEDSTGETIQEAKLIAEIYFENWFFIDIIAALPISAVALTVGQGHQLLFCKLFKLLKVNKIFESFTVSRLQKVFKKYKSAEKILATLELDNVSSTMLMQLIRMMLLLHFLGCIFAYVGQTLVLTERHTWIRDEGLEDASMVKQYLTSCYWAVVTISTVGYGDITPYNSLEIFVAIILVFSGVSLYSYIISRLTTLFSERKGNDSKSREVVLEEFFQEANLPTELRDKLAHFFKIDSHETLSMMYQIRVDELLSLLPINLKASVVYYLFKDAIEIIKVFQDKDQKFYAEYMVRFKPMRVQVNTNFALEGTKCEEVYFLLTGCVRKTSEREKELGIAPQFFIEGAIFGERDVILNRLRSETFTADQDSYVLTLDCDTFNELMNEFEEIRDEIEHIAKERERFHRDQIKKAELFRENNEKADKTLQENDFDENNLRFRVMKESIRLIDKQTIEEVKNELSGKGLNADISPRFALQAKTPMHKNISQMSFPEPFLKPPIIRESEVLKEGGEEELPDDLKGVKKKEPSYTNLLRGSVQTENLRQSAQTDIGVPQNQPKVKNREQLDISSDISLHLLSQEVSFISAPDDPSSDFFVKLQAKMTSFQEKVLNVKELLNSYQKEFEKTFRNNGEFQNEQIKKTAARASEGLGAYTSLMTIFEHYMKDIDSASLKKELVCAIEGTRANEDAYFFLLNKVQACEESILRKVNILSQEHEKATMQKPLRAFKGKRQKLEDKVAATHFKENQQLFKNNFNF